MAYVLVLNAGSSSIKSAVFDTSLTQMASASVTEIGSHAELRINEGAAQTVSAADHEAALDVLFSAFAAAGFPLSGCVAIGHRVVHGGGTFTASVRISDSVRSGIEKYLPLAPLHTPHHLAAIDGVTALAPDLPQVAVFDTAFHATNPPVARRYAIPDTPDTAGLIRYGFHGISYAALVRALPALTGEALPNRLLALHLGNGASLCAIREGRSVATTMGYSPVSGLTMGTRSGDIDAMAVLELARRVGIDSAYSMLNKKSGLFGLSGIDSDMRMLSASSDPNAQFAIEHFVYWAARHAGSMIAAMQGVDAIAFTGGIGENAKDIRMRILTHLAWVGDVQHYVVPAEEEKYIADETFGVVG